MNPEAAVPESPIDTRIRSAESASDALTNKLNDLFGRLAPVLGPDFKTAEAGVCGSPVNEPCPLAKSMDGLKARTMGQISTVDMIMSRLEI